MKQNNLTERQQKYILLKKEQMKEAVKKGNSAKAHRHRVEIIQFLNKGDNEMPIESELDSLEKSSPKQQSQNQQE